MQPHTYASYKSALILCRKLSFHYVENNIRLLPITPNVTIRWRRKITRIERFMRRHRVPRYGNDRVHVSSNAWRIRRCDGLNKQSRTRVSREIHSFVWHPPARSCSPLTFISLALYLPPFSRLSTVHLIFMSPYI